MLQLTAADNISLLMKQAVVHQNLARLFTHKSFGAPIQRAYALWSVLRPEGETWYFYDDVVDMYASKSGKTADTVHSWIKTGVDAGFFKRGRYHDGRPTLSIVGKDRMFSQYLNGVAPGKAILIEADVLLTASLQQLRGILLYTFAVEKSVMRSRNFLGNTIDRVELTTRNYSLAVRQPKRYVYAKQSDGSSRQKSNSWTPSSLYTTRTKPGKDKVIRRGYYPWVKPNRAKKLYYYNRDTAVNVAQQRAKAGDNPVVYHILPDAAVKKSIGAKIFGHVFLEPIYCL